MRKKNSFENMSCSNKVNYLLRKHDLFIQKCDPLEEKYWFVSNMINLYFKSHWGPAGGYTRTLYINHNTLRACRRP